MWFLLVPYVALVLLYVSVYRLHAEDKIEESLKSAVLKCMPILYLIALVYSFDLIDEDQLRHRKLITVALCFSVAGDFFLNWFKTFFLPGVACFGLAQLMYVFAFGVTPLEPITGLIFVISTAIMVFVFIPNIKQPAVKVAVPMYMLVINAMGWRAAARYQTTQEQYDLIGLIGALFFITSDSAIGVNTWLQKFPRSHGFIMVTYYIAQMLIALSVIIPAWTIRSRHHIIGV